MKKVLMMAIRKRKRNQKIKIRKRVDNYLFRQKPLLIRTCTYSFPVRRTKRLRWPSIIFFTDTENPILD